MYYTRVNKHLWEHNCRGLTRNYCSEFAAEETSLEVPETNTDENSLGRGKRVKQFEQQRCGSLLESAFKTNVILRYIR